jgi:8-oxo-dGTP pyrophosphatase MutT (NUDIX family)
MRSQEFTNPGAAGILLYAEDTGRYGFQQRSDSVNDPGVWAAWGGGRKSGETLEQCALRELAEESGYQGPVGLEPLAHNSRYVTFIGRVPREFDPTPNAEVKDHCWVDAGAWPSPMHPGMVMALKNIDTESLVPESQTAKTGIMQTDVYGSRAYHARCLEPGCDWESRRYDRIQQAQAAAKKHAAQHFAARPDVSEVVDPNNPWGPQGNFAGATPVDVGGVSMKNIEVGDTVKYFGQTAKILAMSNNRKYSRINIQSDFGGTTKDVLTSDLKLLGQGMAENFADGRNPQDKGDAKRHGVPTKASVSTLRRVAKQGGRKGQLAHWMANMKAGRARAKRNK